MEDLNQVSNTIEEALFSRMGVTVDNALATATDFVDEKIADASDRGVDIQANMQRLGQVLGRLANPETIEAIECLADRLPRLAELARMSDEIPKLVGMLGDMFDEFQRRRSDEGLDLEQSISNGLQAALWLGTQFDRADLDRIGATLKSGLLGKEGLEVVEDAANALSMAKSDLCHSGAKHRVGFVGLLSALRNPKIQRSLAFALRFGEYFGQNLEEKKDSQSKHVRE